MPGSRMDPEIDIQVNDVTDAFKVRSDIPRDPPGVGYFDDPVAREFPTANIVDYVGPRFSDQPAQFCVAFLLIHFEPFAAAPVDLDEVVAPLLEHQVEVLLFVLIQTAAESALIVIPFGSAGILAGIAVDARFQSLGMDIVGQRFDAGRELLLVDDNIALGIPVDLLKRTIEDTTVLETAECFV